MKVLIAPSLLACDFANLEKEIRRAEAADVDMLHCDIMDGHFVPNLTMGPPVIAAIRKVTKLHLDCHLMVDNAHLFFESFQKAGADAITIHLEVYPEPEPMLDRIGEMGMKRGLCINPDMPVERLRGLLDKVDRLLVMSVFPGFGGQSFIEETYDRLRAIQALSPRPEMEIQVDGGVYAENAAQVVAAGANNLVSGTGLFRADDMAQAVRIMRGEPA